MPKFQHVIFDLDGTLVDSAPAILAAFASALEQSKIVPTVPLDPALIGPPLVPTLKRISGSDDSVLIEKLADRFKEDYDTNKLPLTVAYAGIEEMLSELRKRGAALHIATNKRQKPTLRLLEILGWSDFFSSVYCIDTPPGSDGKSAMLERLLREQNIDRDNAVFVGDTESDELAACANRIEFLSVGWGYGFSNHPQRCLASPDDVLLAC